MPAPIFLETRSNLSGFGALDASDDPSGVRAMSGVSVGVGALMGYGAYYLFKHKHPVWAALVGLSAVSALSTGAYGLVSGKRYF